MARKVPPPVQFCIRSRQALAPFMLNLKYRFVPELIIPAIELVDPNDVMPSVLNFFGLRRRPHHTDAYLGRP